jgi:hypothetical protein
MEIKKKKKEKKKKKKAQVAVKGNNQLCVLCSVNPTLKGQC